MLTAKRLRERRRVAAGLPPVEPPAPAGPPAVVSANEHEAALRNLRSDLETKHAVELKERDRKIAALERALAELRSQAKGLRAELASKPTEEPRTAPDDVPDVEPESDEPAPAGRSKKSRRTTG